MDRNFVSFSRRQVVCPSLVQSCAFAATRGNFNTYEHSGIFTTRSVPVDPTQRLICAAQNREWAVSHTTREFT